MFFKKNKKEQAETPPSIASTPPSVTTGHSKFAPGLNPAPAAIDFGLNQTYQPAEPTPQAIPSSTPSADAYPSATPEPTPQTFDAALAFPEAPTEPANLQDSWSMPSAEPSTQAMEANPTYLGETFEDYTAQQPLPVEANPWTFDSNPPEQHFTDFSPGLVVDSQPLEMTEPMPGLSGSDALNLSADNFSASTFDLPVDMMGQTTQQDTMSPNWETPNEPESPTFINEADWNSANAFPQPEPSLEQTADTLWNNLASPETALPGEQVPLAPGAMLDAINQQLYPDDPFQANELTSDQQAFEEAAQFLFPDTMNAPLEWHEEPETASLAKEEELFSIAYEPPALDLGPSIQSDATDLNDISSFYPSGLEADFSEYTLPSTPELDLGPSMPIVESTEWELPATPETAETDWGTFELNAEAAAFDIPEPPPYSPEPQPEVPFPAVNPEAPNIPALMDDILSERYETPTNALPPELPLEISDVLNNQTADIAEAELSDTFEWPIPESAASEWGESAPTYEAPEMTGAPPLQPMQDYSEPASYALPEPPSGISDASTAAFEMERVFELQPDDQDFYATDFTLNEFGEIVPESPASSQPTEFSLPEATLQPPFPPQAEPPLGPAPETYEPLEPESGMGTFGNTDAFLPPPLPEAPEIFSPEAFQEPPQPTPQQSANFDYALPPVPPLPEAPEASPPVKAELAQPEAAKAQPIPPIAEPYTAPLEQSIQPPTEQAADHSALIGFGPMEAGWETAAAANPFEIGLPSLPQTGAPDASAAMPAPPVQPPSSPPPEPPTFSTQLPYEVPQEAPPAAGIPAPPPILPPQPQAPSGITPLAQSANDPSPLEAQWEEPVTENAAPETNPAPPQEFTLGNLEVLSVCMLTPEKRLLVVQSNGIYALMGQYGVDHPQISVLKLFEQNPIAYQNTFTAVEEAQAASQGMYVVQVGTWHAIISTFQDKITLHTELG